MKIRELEIYGLRNFPPEGRRISFVDPYSDRPRQLTVLVGSNGSGKTTVLECIAEMLARFANAQPWESRVGSAFHSITALFEWDDGEQSEGDWSGGESRLRLIAGLWRGDEGAKVAQHLVYLDDRLPPFLTATQIPGQWVGRLVHGRRTFNGGAIIMHHDRVLPQSADLQISEPETNDSFVVRAGSGDSAASLAQFWFWQNYLDLEAQAEGRPNLTPFIDAIEDLLGHGQRVRIKRGRVTIERPHLGDVIEPHALPSGELQILTLFGELLRHLRPGAIVLIDELEISLHPALQRAVIHKLRALARKHDLQVIVTTHSMEVVSSVAPQEVVLLDNILMQEGIEPGAKAG